MLQLKKTHDGDFCVLYNQQMHQVFINLLVPEFYI
jgi:hypothetical protein